MTNTFIDDPAWYPLKIRKGVSEQQRINSFLNESKEFGDNVLLSCSMSDDRDGFTIYKFMNNFVYVNNNVNNSFKKKFSPYLNDNTLTYDNLINILIMVKNAGDGFRAILERNKPYMDRYTILDTGSTDNTIQIIKETLWDKRGEVYQEPFINFRDSRNRLLELAGTHCAFNIMLDDTYVLNGNLRNVLTFIRGDEYADSFSLVIQGTETLYLSNRITRPQKNTLKYVNKIHEIIETNINISLNKEHGYIKDIHYDYMQDRTSKRKLQDLKILFEMLDEDPENTRTYYYIGDTYIALKQWGNARKWFQKRLNCKSKGYDDEITDSLYYIAAISDEFFKDPWEKCLQLYLKCYNADQTRGDSLYMIGRHYMLNGSINIAYFYMKHAFLLGIPNITMSVRIHIYYKHLPNDLIPICYKMKDYKLGLDACLRYSENNKLQNTSSSKWTNIFQLLLQYNKQLKISGDLSTIIENPIEAPIICFVSYGGWEKWSGKTLYEKGLGGSETFTIKYAEEFFKKGYNVIVFCQCSERSVYNGVTYIPVDYYIKFLAQNIKVKAYIINRYPSFIPLTSESDTGPIYYVAHDLCGNDLMIDTDRLHKICLVSDWHQGYFKKIFPSLAHKTTTISHGIDIQNFTLSKKKKHSLIYCSFPNRGLLPLLQMWPTLKEKWPDATLNIFCDMNHKWVNTHWKQNADDICVLLEKYKNNGVTNHGWVNQNTLRKYWSTSHIWLYPCTFDETCCLTAYEAAASHTLIASNNRAALKDSIGNRGIIIDGNIDSNWKKNMIEELFKVVDTEKEKELIDKNYKWVSDKNFEKVVSNFEESMI